MRWYVRRASLRDLDALDGLCKAAVGEEDYVRAELEVLILRSVVHVALADDRIVGMMSYRPCLDGSAWLGQARTHPDFRRQGVAHAIIQSFVGVARNSKVASLRLWAESTNQESISSFTGAGFREVGRFVRMTKEPSSESPRSAVRRYDEDLWRAVAQSDIVRKGRGYACVDGCFQLVTRPVVFRLASMGRFRGLNRGESDLALSSRGRIRTERGNGNLLTTPEGAEAAEGLEFTMWAGNTVELFLEASRLASMYGKSYAETFIPKDDGILSEVKSAGATVGWWGREAVLAEIRVGVGAHRTRNRPTYRELAATRSGHGHLPSDTLGWARWNP